MNRSPAWHEDAACLNVHVEMFYPEKGEPTKTVKTICRRCPVRIDCLDWALRKPEYFGIWGGCSPRVRTNMLRMLPTPETLCPEHSRIWQQWNTYRPWVTDSTVRDIASIIERNREHMRLIEFVCSGGVEDCGPARV